MVLATVLLLFLSINSVEALDTVEISYQENVIVEPATENTIPITIRSLSYHITSIYFEIKSEVDARVNKNSFILSSMSNETINIFIHTPNDIGLYDIKWSLRATDIEEKRTETKNGVIRVRVSNILKEIKNMKKSYIGQIEELRKISENFSKTDKEYIEYFLSDIERSVKDLDALYIQGEYEKIGTKMRSIETELILIKGKVAELKAAGQQKFYFDIYALMGFVLPALAAVLLSLLFLTRILLTRQLKINRSCDLKIINERILSAPDVKKVPLDVRIKRIEEKVKAIGDKRLLRELKLMKEKYRQGFMGLCEDYLLDLERRLEDYG